MTTKHTPTPWEIHWSITCYDAQDVKHAATKGEKRTVGEEMSRVPKTIGPIGIDHNHWDGWHLAIDKEDAAFIVKAVNAHDDLVAALQRTQKALREARGGIFDDAAKADDAARAALAKVGG